MQTELFFKKKQTSRPGRPSIDETLHATFGFSEFRHGQRALIEALVERRDALGVMPTGGGKSLCFQLPALCMEGTAIIVSPLIALMKDQVDALKARGIAAEAFNSSLTGVEKYELIERLEAGQIKLLYIAPERVQSDGFIRKLQNVAVSFLAVDEAHCISHWGHDFRPDYMRIAELRDAIGNPPCIALTATATKRVQDDIATRLKLQNPMRVVTGFHRPNLSFLVEPCSSRAAKVAELKARIPAAIKDGGSAIVYAATRKNVEWVTKALNQVGIKASYYHAGKTDDQRERVQDKFQVGKMPVLVATNAFGMGIDKPDVRLVAHFDIPGSMEAYYQEAGRAGRDGKPAECVLLFNHADVATQEFFIENSEGKHAEVATTLLKQLVRYAYSKECREHVILDYFGDEEAAQIRECGRCDVCTGGDVTLVDAPEKIQIAGKHILACVYRMQGRFGKSRVAEVMKGSNSAAIRNFGLAGMPGYGALKPWTLVAIRELIDDLIASGLLQVNGLEYPVVGLTEAGKAVLKGENPIRLKQC